MSYLVRIEVLNVGQGLGVILDFNNGQFGVVDCGPRLGAGNVVHQRLKEKVEQGKLGSIEFVLLSHLDVDHIGGLSDILMDSALVARIKKIVCNDAQYRLAVELLRKVGTSLVKQVDAGETGILRHEGSLARIRALGHLKAALANEEAHEHVEVTLAKDDAGKALFRSSMGVNVVALGPTGEMRDVARSGLPDITEAAATRDILRLIPTLERVWNDGCIILSVRAGKKVVLLPGDMTWQALQNLIGEERRRKKLKSDAVVAWHHGGRLWNRGDSTRDRQAWRLALRKAGGLVIISCGTGNRYGHPHQESVEGISAAGGTMVCTQLSEGTWEEGVSESGLRDFLDVLPYSRVSLRRRSGRACWGDVVLEIAEDSTVHLTGEERGEGHPCVVACCRTGS